MKDQPFSSEEIVNMAQERICPDGRDHAWFEEHQKAKQTGHCGVCGWNDGDGVATCFYSKLGAVTHENSDAGAAKTMTEAQRTLYLESGMSHDDFEHFGDHSRCVKSKQASGKFQIPHSCGGQFIQQMSNSRVWICDGCEISVDANDPNFSGMTWSHHHVNTDHKNCVKRGKYWHVPHPGCGGFVESVGAYHIHCSKCGTEVRMWEHGIDYDCG